MSCQFPILDVTDLSSTHKDNVKNNTWHVRTPFPTQEEMKEQEQSGEYLGYEMYYAAEAWVTKDESLTFQVKLLNYSAGQKKRYKYVLFYEAKVPNSDRYSTL